MKILVAEDEPNIALLYKISFEDVGHRVIITRDGEECINEYKKELTKFEEKRNKDTKDVSFDYFKNSPFDVVLLDYRMPRKDGMEVAKDIMNLKPQQRIIFVSAYVLDTLQDAVKDLKKVVEMVQKPCDMDSLLSLVEDTAIWKGLEEMNVNVATLREMNLTHEAIFELLSGLQKLQKGRGLPKI